MMAAMMTHYYIMYITNATPNSSGRDHMEVGFTTTCAISAYHH
jgi:hypothetical protein